MSTNLQLKRLKLKLDIVKIPENRVHKLTDSNVSGFPRQCSVTVCLTRAYQIKSPGGEELARGSEELAARTGRSLRETLESVSSCTRILGFLAISSFGFNRLH